MKIYNVLDVREREGKSPAFAEVGTLFVNDQTGKMSLYLPITGRFYPVKEQQARQAQGASYPQAASAPPPTLPGGGGPGAFPGEPQEYPPTADHAGQVPPEDDVPF